MSASQFDKILQIRAPGLLIEHCDEAASRLGIVRSDFVRITLNKEFRSMGIGLSCWDIAVWGDTPLKETDLA